MGILSTIIGGALGWTLAGPIGAVIGAIVGKAFGRKTHYTTYENSDREPQPHRRYRQNSANDFKMALLVLVAAVMKADNNVKKSELNSFKAFYLNLTNEEETLEALQILKQLLNSTQPLNVPQIAMQCATHLNYSSRMELLHILYKIAAADSDIENSEQKVLNEIAYYFNLNAADHNTIKALFIKVKNDDWAYQVLQLKPDCSDADIKKAYRSLAMKHHPDKVNSLGEDVKQQATEKFRQINEAYNHLKKIRNIA